MKEVEGCNIHLVRVLTRVQSLTPFFYLPYVRAPQGGGDYIDELEAEGGLGLGQDGSTVICGEGWGNFTGVDPVGGFPDLSAVKVRWLPVGVYKYTLP